MKKLCIIAATLALMISAFAKSAADYRKAAEQGDAKAQFILGGCYANGIGVTKDLAEAVKWWRKAAEQGDAKAQFMLGACYANGIGVTKDFAEAVKWYRKVTQQGHQKAKVKLNDLGESW